MIPLHDLAEAAGLVIDWEDASGQARRVADPALSAVLDALGHPNGSDAEIRDSLEGLSRQPREMVVTRQGAHVALDLPSGAARLVLETGEALDVVLGPGRVGAASAVADWPQGYHRLETGGRSLEIAVCPPQARTVTDLLGRPAWGVTAQVYALKDQTPRGFGDFGALAAFAEAAGRAGADALAISPVHALFLADPERYSPYSPSSRDWLNPLFADLGGFDPQGASADIIDWSSAAPAKRDALRRAFADFDGDPAFDRFVRDQGEPLRQHALFEGLHARFFAERGARGWQDWPAEFRCAESPAVAAWAQANPGEVRFHQFCQWRADADLAWAQRRARDAGMGLGLIADLAVGLDPGGSHAWSRPDELLTGLTIGAPPDAFQAAGQGWGITSFSPSALKRLSYAPFLRTVRAALRHAGGLRIDHALGLNRLWVLPDGAAPLEGAYLKNPFRDLLALAALESKRAGAVLIGEDLGVVPPGLRATLEAHGLLGMRVLPFERDPTGAFTDPSTWDVRAAAMTTTHDLAPIAGWWRGRDIDWRERLGAGGDRAQERSDRAADRDALWRAAVDSDAAEGPAPDADDPQAAVDAAVAMTAASRCELALIPVEDLLGLDEAVNLPGVVTVHPNWRRRLPSAAEDVFTQPAVSRRTAQLVRARPRKDEA